MLLCQKCGMAIARRAGGMLCGRHASKRIGI